MSHKSTRLPKTSLSTEYTSGDGRKLTVRQILSLYRKTVQKYIPISGNIQCVHKHDYSVRLNYTGNDCDAFEFDKASKFYSFSTLAAPDTKPTLKNIHCLTDFSEVAEIASANSPNGMYSARLLRPKSNTETSSSKQLLRISEGYSGVTIDISKVSSHGSIVTDPQFGAFVWCPFGKQDKLLYICKPKGPKHLNFTERDPGSEYDDSQNALRGGEYLRQENWGEAVRDIEHTMIGIMDISRNYHVTTIELEDYSLADASWMDNGNQIVSTAYGEQPRKLGLLFCNNRPSKITVHELRAKCKPKLIREIAGSLHSYYSPRVNHRGDCFVYISNPSYGSHHQAGKLNLYVLADGTSEELVDITTSKSEFFLDRLTNTSFTLDDDQIVFCYLDGLKWQIGIFNLKTSKLSNIKFPTVGVRLFDMKDDVLLACGSDINALPTVFLGRLDPAGTADQIDWHPLEEIENLKEIEYETITLETWDKCNFCTGILIKPNLKLIRSQFSYTPTKDIVINHNDLPLVVLPHGGPHSSFTIEYIPIIVFYARLGLRTLLVNYRGSVGVSMEYVRSLYGRAGYLDVEDCKTFLRHLRKKKAINPKKLVIQGGSHGGFLACHLSCQDEFKFTCAIIRNPVVDFPSMYSTTDIPDWVGVESLGRDFYHPGWLPTQGEMTRMYCASALHKADKAKTPTYMALGSEDARVPMSQGMQWVDVLKANGVRALCKVYPDKHDLAKPEVALDNNMTAAIWILYHLREEQSGKRKASE